VQFTISIVENNIIHLICNSQKNLFSTGWILPVTLLELSQSILFILLHTRNF